MDVDYNLENIENTLASWLDGAMDPSEEGAFLDICSRNEVLQEVMDANDQIEETYEEMVENGYELPYEMYGDFDIPLTDGITMNTYTSYEDANDELEEDNQSDDDELFESIDDSGECEINDYGLI